MEKITKTYVEKIYRGLLFSESSIKEVAERNPMQVENDGKMQGFRFYDKEYVVDGEMKLTRQALSIHHLLDLQLLL